MVFFTTFVGLESCEGQKALRFNKIYLDLCSGLMMIPRNIWSRGEDYQQTKTSVTQNYQTSSEDLGS